MAINELENELEKEEQERRKRYPLLEIANNREEIREMSEDTLKYGKEIYPSLAGIDMWELVPRTTMEFMTQYFKVAEEKKSTDNCVFVSMGEFMQIGVEYGETQDADKSGTFNPIIEAGPELQYDNDNPENNKLRMTPAVFSPDDQEMIDFVAKNAQNVLKSKYGVIYQDYQDIYRVVVCFLRKIREYLIEHKDDEEYGTDIDLGNILDIGICRYHADEKDRDEYKVNIQYCIQYAPGQEFKVSAKDDNKTEDEQK